MKQRSYLCSFFFAFALTSACASSQMVTPAEMTSETTQRSCAEKLAKSPCGNPNWDELPPGGAPEESADKVDEQKPEQP
jgi:hypothetical protein